MRFCTKSKRNTIYYTFSYYTKPNKTRIYYISLTF